MQKQKPKSKNNLPAEPWQIDDYNRKLHLDIFLPYPVLLLCKLWDVKPIDIITDFLDNLSHSSWKREGRDLAKHKLVDYILTSSYGKEYYDENDILQMSRELDAIGLLFPNNGSEEALNNYVAFRESFYKHWFNQWYHKTRRKQP